MNITSYNITDVTYHYIGLRVLDHLRADVGRAVQVEEISRNVLKFATDKALRLMLPQPSTSFAGIGPKVCQELVHFRFARLIKGGYELTEAGRSALRLLNMKDYLTLRRMMARAHLQTYDNLRCIVQSHIELGTVWRPVVEAKRTSEPEYLKTLLVPTFGEKSGEMADDVWEKGKGLNAGKVQDALHDRIIKKVMPSHSIRVANFRAICDRLVSLRLLNQRRTHWEGCEFNVSYSPSTAAAPDRAWYVPLKVPLKDNSLFEIFFCEPDMTNQCQQDLLQTAIDEAFCALSPVGGYYDIPELRDWVCQHLLIPEASFDDGINYLLDRQPPMLSAGLQYDRITARRRPLVRRGKQVELHNLIRRL